MSVNMLPSRNVIIPGHPSSKIVLLRWIAGSSASGCDAVLRTAVPGNDQSDVVTT
jgi:hypothetical protein